MVSMDAMLHTPKGIAIAVILNLILNKLRHLKIPIPRAETEPLAAALVVSYVCSRAGVLPRKWHASCTALCYAATASGPAAELLAVAASTRFLTRSVSDLRQREAAAIFMACQPFIIHHWSTHSTTLSAFFRSFLDRHIGFSREQLCRYRQDMESSACWVSMEVSHEPGGPFQVALRTFARCAMKTGQSMGVISLVQSLLALPWGSLGNGGVFGAKVLAAVPAALRHGFQRWLWNTVFLVCVFQSSVLGPLLWNGLMGRRVRRVRRVQVGSESRDSETCSPSIDKDRYEVPAPSMALRCTWWWMVASGIFFEKAGRRKNVAAFMVAQAMVIAMKRIKVDYFGLPLVAASALYFS